MTASLPALPVGWETWPPERKVALRGVLRSAKFKRVYEFDPVAFAHDCIDWDAMGHGSGSPGPTDYQDEIWGLLEEYRLVSVRGPHGLGKSTCAAVAINWFALTRDGDDWKCPSTASKWRQLKEFLWPEIRKVARYVRWDLVGRDPYEPNTEMQDLAIRLSTGSAFAAASNDPAAIEGAHADRLFYVFDESKSIPEETFDAAEGAFSGAGKDTGAEIFGLMLSTPGPTFGRFYQTQKRGVPGWKAVHVTLERAMAAGRISGEWVEKVAAAWGRESAMFKNRALGEFATGSDRTVVPLEWVEAAVERWMEASVPAIGDVPESRVFEKRMIPDESLGLLTCEGVDVSDQGEDRTVLALRYGPCIAEIVRVPYSPDIMESTGAAVAVLRRVRGQDGPAAYAVVDSIGVGAGVVSRMRELKDEGEGWLEYVAFDASAKAETTDAAGEISFENSRASAWWGMRERLHPVTGDDLLLPPDDDLIAELTTPTWKQSSRGRVLIESKDDLRKADRLGRSPDVADAVVMSFAPQPPPVAWEIRTGSSIGPRRHRPGPPS